MDPQTASTNPVWPFPFVPQDWEHTPTAVQAYVHTLHNRDREKPRGSPLPHHLAYGSVPRRFGVVT